MMRNITDHSFEGNFAIQETLMPENYDSGELILISTIWDGKTKRGESIVVRQVQKCFWELDGNVRKVTGYRTKAETVKRHKEIADTHGGNVFAR